jgi:HlyD family secretion protein
MSAATAESPALPRRSLGLDELVAREQNRRRRRRTFRWAVLVAVPLALAVLWLALLRPRPVPLSARFRVQPVTQGDVTRTVRASGHVEAIETVSVGAEVSGRVAEVLVDYNDRVTRGQVLARFDRTSLAAQVAQSQAALSSARFAAQQATTDREKAQRDLARGEGLYESKSISTAEHDAIATSARLADQRLAAARAQVDAAQASYSVAKTNLDHGVIVSPIDGVVITRNIDPGQTVASTLQTPVLFTVAADLSKMRVIAAVDEADIGEVKQGQRATFTVNAYPDRVFEGVVTEVRNAPVVVQDVVTYGTVVHVDNPDLALKPGMTASAHIVTATAKGVLRAPSAALELRVPGEQVDGAGVWVLDGETLKRVRVKAGIADEDNTAIVPEGALSPATRVLVELTPAGRKAYGVEH